MDSVDSVFTNFAIRVRAFLSVPVSSVLPLCCGQFLVICPVFPHNKKQRLGFFCLGIPGALLLGGYIFFFHVLLGAPPLLGGLTSSPHSSKRTSVSFSLETPFRIMKTISSSPPVPSLRYSFS